MAGWQDARTTKNISVDIDVDVVLEEFKPEQLIKALVEHEWLSETEADEICKRSAKESRGRLSFQEKEPSPVPPEILSDAWCEIMRGRKSEALYLIERALGKEWLGRLS